jgi:hypothetical protein
MLVPTEIHRLGVGCKGEVIQLSIGFQPELKGKIDKLRISLNKIVEEQDYAIDDV